MATDPRIDAYIAKVAPFAKPILTHLCGMAAFKAHCTFGFWNRALVVAQSDDKTADAMGRFGRITTLKDLPPARALKGYVRTAARLVDEGASRPRPQVRKRPPLRLPADLKQALAGNARAAATFDTLSPSHKREYLEWILEAKTAPTRARRLATTVQWLAEGRHRNWKYDR